MALHLITGYAGTEHITSADQGAYNMGTFGEGEFVLDRGNKFEATVVSNNLITLADGEALMQGRFIKMISGTTEEVAIENGTQEMNRNDLICIRYEKNGTTSIESASIVVKKGTETSGTPEDPEYVTGEITDGNDLVNEMPLYRVQLQGLNITNVEALFELKRPTAPQGWDLLYKKKRYIATQSGINYSEDLPFSWNELLSKYKGIYIQHKHRRSTEVDWPNIYDTAFEGYVFFELFANDPQFTGYLSFERKNIVGQVWSIDSDHQVPTYEGAAEHRIEVQPTRIRLSLFLNYYTPTNNYSTVTGADGKKYTVANTAKVSNYVGNQAFVIWGIPR